jgi:hypothetical protein
METQMANPSPDDMLNGLVAQQPSPAPSQSTSQSVSVQQPLPADPAVAAQQRANVEPAIADIASIDVNAAPREGKKAMAGVQKRTADAMKPLDERAQKLGKLAEAVDTDLSEAQKTYDKHQTAYDEMMAQQQSQVQRLDTLSKDIAANSTPRDFWADKSTGFKIGAAVFAGLGAFAGSTQPVQIIDNAIQRDLTLQRLKLQNDKDNYANQTSLLGQMRAIHKDTRDADKAAYLAAIQGAKGRLQAIAGATNDVGQQRQIAATIAGLDEKAAVVGPELISKSTGQALEQKTAVANAKTNLEKLTAAQTGVGVLKAETAAKNAAVRDQENQRKQEDQDQKKAAMEIPDWEIADPNKKNPNATQKEISGLKAAEVSTRQVTSAMDELIKSLGAAKDRSKLLDNNEYREYKAKEGRLFEAARGPGFGQTGSRLTKELKDLESQSFTPGWLGRLTPDESIRLLRQAQAAIWNKVGQAGHELGLKPSKTHPELGE